MVPAHATVSYPRPAVGVRRRAWKSTSQRKAVSPAQGRPWRGSSALLQAQAAAPYWLTVGEGMFDTKDEAQEAALKAVADSRSLLLALLPADLAATTDEWPEPIVNAWDA
jgi:hypothetical protein